MIKNYELLRTDGVRRYDERINNSNRRCCILLKTASKQNVRTKTSVRNVSHYRDEIKALKKKAKVVKGRHLVEAYE